MRFFKTALTAAVLAAGLASTARAACGDGAANGHIDLTGPDCATLNAAFVRDAATLEARASAGAVWSKTTVNGIEIESREMELPNSSIRVALFREADGPMIIIEVYDNGPEFGRLAGITFGGDGALVALDYRTITSEGHAPRHDVMEAAALYAYAASLP